MPSMLTYPAALSIKDWQELAAGKPDQAARELSNLLLHTLSPAQQRACFADITMENLLATAFQRAAADSRAPLAGVPYTLKDLYHVAGHQPRAGSRFPFEILPKQTETNKLPHTLQNLGAILAARTNLYEFAYGLTGENAHHGDCEHPLFPGRTTGGSSSGAAASVAAGIVPLAIGTDTGGSIRVPAAFCGLYGMRMMPGDEWISDAFPLAPSFDTAGWLTRSAEDMLTAHRAILGEVPRPAQEPRGCYLDLSTFGVSASKEMGRSLRDAGKQLAPSADATTRDQLAHAFEGASQAYAILQSAEAFDVHARWIDKHRKHYSADVWKRIDRGRHWTQVQFEAAQFKHKAVRSIWTSFFKTYDYLVMPVAPFPALTKAECTQASRDRLLALTVPASLGGRPVLTIPVPLASGLSLGLQIVVPSPVSPVIPWLLNRTIGT